MGCEERLRVLKSSLWTALMRLNAVKGETYQQGFLDGGKRRCAIETERFVLVGSESAVKFGCLVKAVDCAVVKKKGVVVFLFNSPRFLVFDAREVAKQQLFEESFFWSLGELKPREEFEASEGK